nr:unnamed protein product [Digitaria exilis]
MVAAAAAMCRDYSNTQHLEFVKSLPDQEVNRGNTGSQKRSLARAGWAAAVTTGGGNEPATFRRRRRCAGTPEATMGGGDPAATVGGGDEPATVGRRRGCGRDAHPACGVFIGSFAMIVRGGRSWLQTWASDVGRR